MTNETTPARRIDDRLQSQSLNWDDQPEAVRKERANKGAELANAMADAGAAYLAHMGAGGGIAAIPHTGPAQYVVAGTMAAISKVLGEQMGSTAAGEVVAPIGIVTTWNKGGSGEHNSIEPYDRYQRDERGYSLAASLPEGTKLYAEPIASQSQAAQPTSLSESEITGLANLTDRIEEADEQPIAIARSAARAIDKLLATYAAHIAGTSQATKAQAEPNELIADLGAFTEGSVRDFPDFREDLERLSDPGLAKKQAKIIRKEIYDTIDARVRNAVKAALAAPVANEAPAVPELTVWYGPTPESNGASNFTATLMRKGASMFDTDSYTFARSEYPDRVRYEADSMRYLIGELAEKPCILDYDADKHSGYIEPVASVAKEATRDAEATEKANVLPPEGDK